MTLHRSDSDPAQLVQPRRTAPVKCPPRKQTHALDFGHPSSPSEGEDSQYLMKMYDSRTWELYRKITESRKKSQFKLKNSPVNEIPTEPSNAWENLQQDDKTALDEEHQMVFLFDFD